MRIALLYGILLVLLIALGDPNVFWIGIASVMLGSIVGIVLQKHGARWRMTTLNLRTDGTRPGAEESNWLKAA